MREAVGASSGDNRAGAPITGRQNATARTSTFPKAAGRAISALSRAGLDASVRCPRKPDTASGEKRRLRAYRWSPQVLRYTLSRRNSDNCPEALFLSLVTSILPECLGKFAAVCFVLRITNKRLCSAEVNPTRPSVLNTAAISEEPHCFTGSINARPLYGYIVLDRAAAEVQRIPCVYNLVFGR